MPALCRMIEGRPGSLIQLAQAFVRDYPMVSKRQAEFRLNEIAVKEKRAEDSVKAWHVRPEFERYLHLPVPPPMPSGVPAADGTAPSSCSASSLPSAAATTTTPTPKKRKSSSLESSATPAASSSSAVKKPRKSSSSASAAEGTAMTSPSSPAGAARAATSSTLVPPKKFKRAFGFFVKAKRHEVERQLKAGDANKTVSTKDLKQQLLKLWEVIDEASRAEYERKEHEDRVR